MVNSNKDPNSKRSKRRENRGFVSLEKSSRKHRRAAARLAVKCTLGGKSFAPGESTVIALNGMTYHAGGCYDYHC